jgi:hypothetical protein
LTAATSILPLNRPENIISKNILLRSNNTTPATSFFYCLILIKVAEKS